MLAWCPSAYHILMVYVCSFGGFRSICLQCGTYMDTLLQLNCTGQQLQCMHTHMHIFMYMLCQQLHNVGSLAGGGDGFISYCYRCVACQPTAEVHRMLLVVPPGADVACLSCVPPGPGVHSWVACMPGRVADGNIGTFSTCRL